MIDYKPPHYTRAGDDWIIEDSSAFLRDFAIHLEDIPLWHKEMVGQGRFWQIIRLRYRVHPSFDLSDDNVDMMRAWSVKEIAEKLSQKVEVIESELNQTFRFWSQKRADAARELAEKGELIRSSVPIPIAPKESVEPVAPVEKSLMPTVPQSAAPPKVVVSNVDAESQEVLPSFAVRRIQPEPSKRMLNELGIVIKDDDDACYMAVRAIGFERWLKEDLTRQLAVNILRHEINLRSNQKKMDALSHQCDDVKLPSDKRLLMLREYRELQEASTKLGTAYRLALDELGGEQTAVDDMKRQAINTLGFITQAISTYRANGDNSLIDGVFTAREISWQLAPVPLRSGQYRPDIVAVVKEAMKAEHIFDPNYAVPKITRAVCRHLSRMREIFEAELGVVDNRHTVIEAAVEGGDEGSDVGQSQSAAANAPLYSPDATGAPEQSSAPTPVPYAAMNRNTEDDLISFVSS